jgi:hypothetical protein
MDFPNSKTSSAIQFRKRPNPRDSGGANSQEHQKPVDIDLGKTEQKLSENLHINACKPLLDVCSNWTRNYFD